MSATIVTGCGKSGTHWLAHVLSTVVDARHEPEHENVVCDVIVSCLLNTKVPELLRYGHRVIHLVRDGRDVVRSRHTGADMDRASVVHAARYWAAAVDRCDMAPTVRLEDLTARQGASTSYTLPHWTEWTPDITEAFWDVAGEQMTRHGYTR